MTENQYPERVRLAWLIILICFGVFLILCVSAPLLTSSYLKRATSPLSMHLVANQGTIVVTNEEGNQTAILAGNPSQNIEPGAAIMANDADTALLLLFTPDNARMVARTQIYGGTQITVTQATSARFARYSEEPDNIEIHLNQGRLQLSVPPMPPSSTVNSATINVITPQGSVKLQDAGNYAITVSEDSTDLAVQDGTAVIANQAEQLSLQTDQRAELMAGAPPNGPLEMEHNLLLNGDFNQGDAEWTLLSWNIERSGEPTGNTSFTAIIGEPTLAFKREGIGHADAGARQVIDQDVTDFQSLQLHISMKIEVQSLGVCGVQGSECPLIVRLEYEDLNGNPQVWQQGFYAFGDISPSTPDICVSCSPPRTEHVRVPLDQLFFFESGNLMPELASQGIEPRRLKSLTLIASGHTFTTQVIDAALTAEEWR